MDLCNSVSSKQQPTPLNAEQIAELRRRIADVDAGRMQSHSWHDVKRRLLNPPT